MTKRNYLLPVLLGCCVFLAAGAVQAGDLYQLNYVVCGPVPTLPATVVLNVYEGDQADPNDLKGTSSELFVSNGPPTVVIEDHVCDAVACLTDTRIIGGEFCIEFQINGYDNGKFKSNSYFELVINGVAYGYNQHTSCSQPIPLNEPFDIGGYTWEVVGGVGDCLPGAPGCPEGDKMYSVEGEFRLDLAGCNPTDITFNLYKSDESGVDKIKAQATATWTGSGLTDIMCDVIRSACLLDAYIDPETGELVILFESAGQKDNGEFESDSTWEFDLGACGVYRTPKIHTSCSRVFYLNLPHPTGDGTTTFTDACGGCVASIPVSVDDSSWGKVKALYR